MSGFFETFVTAVREHGLALVVGTTLLLLVFAILVRSTRSLTKKNALASAAMLAVAGYVAIAVVPLPRIAGSLSAPGNEPSTPQFELPPAPTSPHPRATEPAPTGEERLFANAGAAEIEAQGDRAPDRLAATDTLANSNLLTGDLPADESTTSASAPWEPARWIAAITLTGALLCCLQLWIGWLRLRRVLRDSRAAPKDIAHLVALPARTRVRIARRAVQPFCFGLRQTTIVLPNRMASATDETRFVLLHERAHLISGDTRARLIAALLRPVLFWHPLYWWLQHQLRFTSELLADDAAAEGSVAEYVRCMMTLSTHPDPAAGGALVAMIFRRRSELFRRLEMMLQRNEAITHSQSRRSRWSRAVSTLALVAVCASAFGVQPAAAQSAGGQSPAEQSPRSAAVRNQVKELRAELKRLQREIKALREEKKESQPEITFGRLNEATGSVEPVVAPRHPGDGALLPGQLPSRLRNPGTKTHVVKAGETFAKIARQHYGTAKRADLLRKLNPDIDPRRLRVGERLNVLRSGPQNPNSAIGIGGGSGGQRPRRPKQFAPGASALGGGATGLNRPRKPNRQPADAPAPRRTPGAAIPPRALPAPARTPSAPAAAGTAGSGSNSELAGLVTRCIELRGQVDIERINLEYAQTKRERQIGEIKLRTTKQQHDAIQAMLMAELHNAEANLVRTRQLHQKGLVPTHALSKDQGKITLLQRALK